MCSKVSTAQQIIGAKAVLAIFMMRDLLLSTLLPASLNSGVGHLAIIDDRCLADYLESILKSKQRNVFVSLLQNLNAFSVVSITAHAFGVLFGFHNGARRDHLFLLCCKRLFALAQIRLLRFHQ